MQRFVKSLKLSFFDLNFIFRQSIHIYVHVHVCTWMAMKYNNIGGSVDEGNINPGQDMFNVLGMLVP